MNNTVKKAVADMSFEELNLAMFRACNASRDTEMHKQAVQQWNLENGYNGEQVPYEQMTLDQRSWVNLRAQQIKMGKES